MRESKHDAAPCLPALLRVLFGRANVHAQQFVVVARACARPEQFPFVAGRRIDGPHARTIIHVQRVVFASAIGVCWMPEK
jgi:hypothetical protein